MNEKSMTRSRLEAFSDGVIAIAITIMVLELKVPQSPRADALRPLLPVFLGHTLSFIYLGIYWSNHHHLFQLVRRVNGTILWANLHLLFWLSLIPFVTEWIGENYQARVPVALYGVVLLGAGVAYTILVYALVQEHGRESALKSAIGRNIKGKISLAMYFLGIVLTCASTWISCTLYVAVAIMWLVPDPRVERTLAERGELPKVD